MLRRSSWRAPFEHANRMRLAIQTQFGRALHTFNDAEVALRAGAEALQRLLVGLVLASYQRSVVAVGSSNARQTTEAPARLIPRRPLRPLRQQSICTPPTNARAPTSKDSQKRGVET
jgi:hypothetical protein